MTGLLMNAQHADRVIICGIAIEQLVLSVLGIWLALMVPYGGGPYPVLTVYVLWGFASAVFLFSGRFLSRVIAIPWNLIFTTYVIRKPLVGHAHNQTDRIIQAWGLCNLLVLAYLVGTAIVQWRRQRASVSSA